MNWRRPQNLGVACLAIIITLLGLWFWFSASRPSAVRLTFLGSTNDPTRGTVSVFEVVNPLEERLYFRHGFYQRADRQPHGPRREDRWIPRMVVSGPSFSFAAHSTRRFEFLAPTNFPRCFAVFSFQRDGRMMNPNVWWKVRFAVADFLWSWSGHSSSGTQRLCERLRGLEVAESEPFEIEL